MSSYKCHVSKFRRDIRQQRLFSLRLGGETNLIARARTNLSQSSARPLAVARLLFPPLAQRRAGDFQLLCSCCHGNELEKPIFRKLLKWLKLACRRFSEEETHIIRGQIDHRSIWRGFRDFIRANDKQLLEYILARAFCSDRYERRNQRIQLGFWLRVRWRCRTT